MRKSKAPETMLEMLRREHPEEIGEQYPGGVRLCPEDLGYEVETRCVYLRALAKGEPIGPDTCLNCWNRIPDVHAEKK